MFDQQNSEDSFVIPQRGAGKHFREVTSRNDIDQINFETENGRHLADLPIRINVKNTIPRIFRLPMQAIVTAISILARIFSIRITLFLSKDEK